jgi:hypothetical protein
VNYYLIDFENVKTDGIKDLHGVHKGDVMTFFYSENCKNISLEVLDSISKLKVKYKGFNVKVGTKNALDFQLTSYLGYLIGKGNTDENYYIVSEDKGFEVVADFWKEQGIAVSCITFKDATTQAVNKPQPQAPKEKPKKKLNKAASKDLATLNEIKSLIGKNNDPDVVLKIFNQNKTKQAICNGMAKHFKDSKKTSEIYKNLKPLLKSKNKS